MNRLLSRCLAGMVMLASTLSLGCPSSVYRGESTLNEDGSLDRAIYQPADDTTPEAARKGLLWKQVTYAPNPDTLAKQNFNGPLTDLPIREPNKDLPYFAAWGKFKSTKDVPEYYTKKAPEKSGLPDAKLVRNLSRSEYGLVTEYRWSETLTDVVTQEGMRKARDELADLAIGLFGDVFEEAYGQDWDATALLKWLKDEAKPWWAEMTDYAYLYFLNHKSPTTEDTLVGEGLRSICARHGLELTKTGEGKLDGDVNGRIFADFVLTVLCKHVRSRKDGKSLDTNTAMRWLDDLNKGGNGKDENSGIWQTAMKKVVAARYGGEAVLDGQLAVLVARIFGLHYPESFGHERHFEYSMTVPGAVIDTNGELVAPNKVKWNFPTKLAYPQGYAMTVRSLAVDEKLAKQVLGDDRLKDVKARQSYVYVWKWGPKGLREAMAEAQKRNSPIPLEAYRNQASPEDQKWLQELEKAFRGPPPEAPPKK